MFISIFQALYLHSFYYCSHPTQNSHDSHFLPLSDLLITLLIKFIILFLTLLDFHFKRLHVLNFESISFIPKVAN